MLRRLVKPLRRRLRPVKRGLRRAWRGRRPLILMYHRIGAAGEDPWAITVSARNFAEQLEVLRAQRRVIPLRELVEQLRGGDLAPDSAVVTFDDGYADNLHLAKPALERFDTPATIFVATGAVERRREFYWDELGRILLEPRTLPGRLSLEIGGAARQWSLEGATAFGAADAARYRTWRTGEPAPTRRHALYLELWSLLRPMEESAREPILERLRAWAGVPAGARADRRFLTRDELAALGAGNLIEIGAHGVTHSSFLMQPPPTVDFEVRRSKAELEQWLGRPVPSFAYPYGDHDGTSVDAVRRAGFACACTTVPGAVRRDSDPVRLPRIQVCDWDGEEFARRLAMRLVD